MSFLVDFPLASFKKIILLRKINYFCYSLNNCLVDKNFEKKPRMSYLGLKKMIGKIF